MLDTHVYEVLPGEVLFRRSGNSSIKFITCKVVRTRAIVFEQGGTDAEVGVDLLATGYERLRFKGWFEDWNMAKDNLGDRFVEGIQAGRPIEVAVEASMLDHIIATGRHITQHSLPFADKLLRPFGVPLVAVRVDGRWIEPEPSNMSAE